MNVSPNILALVKATPVAQAAYRVGKSHEARVVVDRQGGTEVTSKKDGDLSGNFSRRFDMDGMRRQTPQRWMQFLRAHFPDHLTVAVVFDVDEKTARNWWNGKHEPRLSAFLALARSAKRQARAAIMSFMLEAA